jgi:N-methylhydantoinase B
MNDEALRLILMNTRVPEANHGDLMAQVAACRLADLRLREIFGRFGIDQVARAIASLFDYSEKRVRAAIEAVPDGVYRGEQIVDSDGVTEEPIRIVVDVRITGSDLVFDFSECERQRAGACGNAHLVNTIAACRVVTKCLFGPDVITNEGFYRPMSVVTVPGSVVHPLAPAPVTVWDNIGTGIVEAMFFALAAVMPERVAAGAFGGVQAMAIAGTDPRSGEEFIHFMPYAGGWGARRERDGVNALSSMLNGDQNNVPCEVTETRFPLTVERYELVPDSGGPGRKRGGLAARIDYRIECDDASVSASLGRYRFPPPGLFGGGAGMPSALIMNLGTTEEANEPRVGGATIARGRVLSHRSGGGGGFGVSTERSRGEVEWDLAQGYISTQAAAEHYGWKPPLREGTGSGP